MSRIRKMTNQKKGTVVLCVCKTAVSSLKCHYNIRLTWRAVICWGKSTCYDAEDRHWREVTAELSWSEKHVLQVFIKINGKFMCKKIILSPVAASLHAIQTLTKRWFLFLFTLDIQRRPGKGNFKHIWRFFKMFYSLWKDIIPLWHCFFSHWFGHQKLGESQVFLL